MKPRSRPEDSQLDLFRADFDQLLNLDHPLCVLARKIDWSRFDVAFAECYSKKDGAPGKDIRLRGKRSICPSDDQPCNRVKVAGGGRR